MSNMKIAVCVPTHGEPQVKSVLALIKAGLAPNDYISRFNDRDSKGKGYALRMAVRAVESFLPEYYIFIDGDGDIDPKQIGTVVHHLKLGYDVVVGKKQLPKKWDRRILTFASRLWIKMLFGLDVDTQTGLKGFNYKPEWKTDSWAFDMEILYKAKKAGKTMYEVPVEAVVSSGKSVRDIVSTLIDSIKIRWEL